MNSTAEQASAHGATMDGIYRFQRHIYDVTRRYYLLGRDQLLDQLNVPVKGTVLEIGCGTGRNLIGVAKRAPSAKLFGLDISEEMLKSALASMARHGCMSQARLACVDATNFSSQAVFGRNQFDRIFFSYTLSMIPNWQQSADHALDFLAPGGELHIVDFGQCERLPGSFRQALFSWLNLFHVTPRQDLAQHLKKSAAARGFNFSVESKFRDYAWLMKITRA